MNTFEASHEGWQRYPFLELAEKKIKRTARHAPLQIWFLHLNV